MSSVAERRRTLSRPAVSAGAVRATMSPIMAITTSISRSVTPRALLAFPTDNIGIDSVAASLAICAVAENVRAVAMLPGVAVNIIHAPGVLGNLLVHIRTVPLGD